MYCVSMCLPLNHIVCSSIASDKCKNANSYDTILIITQLNQSIHTPNPCICGRVFEALRVSASSRMGS